jgi:hypothetical protein
VTGREAANAGDPYAAQNIFKNRDMQVRSLKFTLKTIAVPVLPSSIEYKTTRFHKKGAKLFPIRQRIN